MLRFELKAVDVNNKEQNSGALQMLQKLVAHALVKMGSLNETGQIGEANPPKILELGNSQVRSQGGEGVAGDLWAGTRQRLQQGALASIGEAYKADVGDKLEVKANAASLTGQTEKVRRFATSHSTCKKKYR